MDYTGRHPSNVCRCSAHHLKSKNNMKPKSNKPAVPRNHVFFAIEPETDRESYAVLKKLLHKHYPFFDPKALDVGRYLDGAEKPDAVFYPGTITLNEHLARLEAEEQKFANENIDVIPEGSGNGTLFRFAVRTLKRYGNCEKAIKRFQIEADKCVPILEDSELNTIWNSALKYYGRIKQQADYISQKNTINRRNFNGNSRFHSIALMFLHFLWKHCQLLSRNM